MHIATQIHYIESKHGIRELQQRGDTQTDRMVLHRLIADRGGTERGHYNANRTLPGWSLVKFP